jgi:CRISPR-associated protein Cas1
MPINLHTLPQFADRISWIYVEYGHLEKDNDGLVFIDKAGRTPLPVAATSMLMLGPGTTLTHRAAIAASQMNCLLSWVGEGVTRTYALSTGGASHTANLQRQARLWADPAVHLAVVRNLYAMRFPDPIPPETTLEQIRGMEGARVRAMYQRLAQEVGITWVMRHYDPNNWTRADLPNRCLSAATAALYGVVHAAIVATGYSAALGFIHTGKPLSFVYDIADLYKPDLAVRIAFHVAAEKPQHAEREVRKRCREAFYQERLMSRILPDIHRALTVAGEAEEPAWITTPENGWWQEEAIDAGDDSDGLSVTIAR